MKWLQIPLGPMQTNCYLLFNSKKECIVFDPGEQGQELNTYLKKEGYQPLAILLTHAHFDHIGAIDVVREQWNIPVYVHEMEAEWLTNPLLNGSKRFGTEITIKPADQLIHEEGELKIGNFSFELFHTPGHSPGSISYYVKESAIVFAGDTLFASSIGRTDLTGGSYSELMESIHTKLLVLPDHTHVLSGHGPMTTVIKEKNENPFLK
ncbi:MBL fold metallo-hydrolase [Bacillus niameyensis]|uniref:MBL fold metallo-hydrolase n=1 Tax=Bacillus niameyensis TaxID=1522308 RepID=UPI000781477B|nr:MBL fold metallo-hydrolase [Bacillus niameyensis]